MRFRRKLRVPGEPGAGGRLTPAPPARVVPVGREPEGVNPYDTGSTRPADPPRSGTQRLSARPERARPCDPYSTADRRSGGRSWNDAFIDTWVEHD